MSLQAFTIDDVQKHNNAASCYVTRGDNVYDITEFLQDHPGGEEIVLEYAGKDIGTVMADPVEHEHSEGAYEMLEDFLVGRISKKSKGDIEITVHPIKEINNESLTEKADFTDVPEDTDITNDYAKHRFLDLNKPLLAQVWQGNFSKDFYLDQVHKPRHFQGGKSARLFTYDWMEPLSKTPWFVIPSIWGPAVLFGCYTASQGLAPLHEIGFYALGLFIWTLVEYTLHRCLFHLDELMPDNRVMITLHFLLHGVHHYLPMDRLRLVMPPTLFIVLATPFWFLAHSLFPYYPAIAVYSGGVTGYIFYDLFHYFSHHKKLPSFLMSAKSYHLAHHYKNYQLGFGVSPPAKVWDHIFGTALIITDPIPMKSA